MDADEPAACKSAESTRRYQLTLLCLQADARAWLIHAEPLGGLPHAPGHVN